MPHLTSITDPDPQDPGLFSHQDLFRIRKKNRILKNLKKLNVDQNHQKIIPKFFERRLFFVKKSYMAIFNSYIKWSSSKNLVTTLKGIKSTQEIMKFLIFGQFQAGSGSDFKFFKKDPGSGTGAKLSGSATLHLTTGLSRVLSGYIKEISIYIEIRLGLHQGLFIVDSPLSPVAPPPSSA